MTDISRLIGPDPRFAVRRDGAVDPDGRCVIYWMQRSQRSLDNPALNLAIDLGNALKLPVCAVFGITPHFPSAQHRHYRFLFDALPEIRQALEIRGVPFLVRVGRPDAIILAIAHEARAAVVIGDENPLRVGQGWRSAATESLKVPYITVDSDVVVPTSLFPREEYAARTLRPKIHKVLPDYLQPIPNPKAHTRWPESSLPRGEAIDPETLLATVKVGGAGEVKGYRGGPVEARRRLKRFIADRLPGYATNRNQPTPYTTTELSAHLHFGHISPLTMSLAAQNSGAPQEDVDSYLEELIVRRELAINFVSRNPDYDTLAGCPNWARETLAKHAKDPRAFSYNAAAIEAAETHDPIWNAAQKEMMLTGRMHNYLRMYWAKKILEWSPDAETAFHVAIDQNDRYEMDGRDPNGFTGVAWAIGGKHDRPWPERPIYGTVRSMTYDGIRRKLDTDAYIARVRSIERGARSLPFMDEE